MRRFPALAMIVASCLWAAPAPAEGERLGIVFPSGWHEAYRSQGVDVQLSEWTPAGESVGNWTDMITVALLRGRSDLDPVGYLQAFLDEFQAKCGEFRSRDVASRKERGRLTAVAFMECRRPDPRKFGPEILLREIEVLMVKAIRGLENFYVVQRAWHGDTVGPGHPMHSEDAGAAWVRFMEQARVCDERPPGISCR